MIAKLISLGFKISRNNNNYFLKKNCDGVEVTIKISYEKSIDWTSTGKLTEEGDPEDPNPHFEISLEAGEAIYSGLGIKYFSDSEFFSKEEKEAIDNLSYISYDGFRFSNLSENRYWSDEKYFEKEKALLSELQGYREQKC